MDTGVCTAVLFLRAPVSLCPSVCLAAESPQVSLNVGTSLMLQEEEEQKVVCEARGYYPLDVQLEWLKEQRGGNRLPEVLKNILFSSHRRQNDGTYSLSVFFLLHPSIMDSGSTYTCRASHHSLRVPIRKSFTLTVTGEPSPIQHPHPYSTFTLSQVNPHPYSTLTLSQVNPHPYSTLTLSQVNPHPYSTLTLSQVNPHPYSTLTLSQVNPQP